MTEIIPFDFEARRRLKREFAERQELALGALSRVEALDSRVLPKFAWDSLRCSRRDRLTPGHERRSFEALNIAFHALRRALDEFSDPEAHW